MTKRPLKAVAVVAASLLALAGCSSAGPAASGGQENGPANGDKKALNMVVIEGWAENVAVANVWKQVLKQKGYDITFKTAAVGPTYAGMASGDLDLNFDAWLPYGQKNYWDKYGKDLINLGPWYTDAPLTIAVNEDAPIDSLTELADHADAFDNRIVGIEAGTGEMGRVADHVVPDYGLEKMDVVTSSSPAMLAQLKKAVKEHKNIVVTLWKPHWAYAALPIKDLRDPKGSMGKANEIDTVVRKGFDKDYPTLTTWLKHFTFPPDLLADLENELFNVGGGAEEDEYPAIVKKWLAEHKDFERSLTAS